MDIVREYALATRPWSFTAAIIPVLVTTALLGQSFFCANFLRAMAMAISVQAGANLTNTYYDFVNGVDTKTSVCGDMTLVEKKISTRGCFFASVIFYLVAVAAILPLLILPNDSQLKLIFFGGMALAFFYTAGIGGIMGLKYIAMGDITIFVCFGPLLMQATSLILTGEMNDALYLYSVPIGLVTEGILHANNARDIVADQKSGAVTLATIVGFNISLYIYIALFVGAYAAIIYIALFQHSGCLAVALTVPLAIGLIKKFKEKDLKELPEETAKMHLPFGILLLIGILATSQGLLS